MKRIVYCAGAYSALNQDLIQVNIELARRVGLQVRALGYIPMVPHVAILPAPDLTWDLAMQECLEIMSRCCAVLMIEGWADSKGARLEHERAKEWGLPVAYSLHELQALVVAVP
jgi:hypothetical protein